MERRLDDRVKHYRKTGQGWASLINDISLKAYQFPKGRAGCTEEDCAAFLLSFHPRIKRLVKRYENIGKNFDAYLHSCLRWHLKTYIRQRAKADKSEQVLLRESYLSQQDIVREIESPGDPAFPGVPVKRGPFLLDAAGRLQRKSSVRQFIILALKSILFLGDQTIDRIASVSGIHRDSLYHFIEILRFTMQGKMDRLECLRLRRNRNYLRMHYLGEELLHCTDDGKKRSLRKKLVREHRLYDSTNREIARVPKTPTHREIARLLGLPKGSVDSSCHYLKRFFLEPEN